LTLLSPQQRAFTFNEFVVALAITLIVSLVFAFLTRDVLIRVRVARVNDEQLLLRRAIHNYTVDWRDYPAVDGQLDMLVAPTTYVASLPQDVFSDDPVRHPSYRYFRQPGGGIAWVLVSPGPDGVLDFHPWSGRGALSAIRAAEGSPDASGDNGGDESRDELSGDRDLRSPWAAAIARARTPTREIEDSGSEDEEAAAASAPATAPFYRRAFLDYLSSVSYDPTNGTMSGGDIILVTER
jgi:hypothetical protein